MASGISPISSRNSVPPFACSKRPTRRRSAPVNAPFSWPKSSLSRSDLGERGAVQRHERLRRARAERVDRARELALAGAALARDEHGRARRRDLRATPIDLLHRGARADQALEALAVALAQLAAQVLGLDPERAALERALDRERERVEVDRLREVVVGARAHRATAEATSPNAVTTMTGRSRSCSRSFAEQLDAVHAGHLEVGDDDVGRAIGRDLERALPSRPSRRSSPPLRAGGRDPSVCRARRRRSGHGTGPCRSWQCSWMVAPANPAPPRKTRRSRADGSDDAHGLRPRANGARRRPAAPSPHPRSRRHVHCDRRPRWPLHPRSSRKRLCSARAASRRSIAWARSTSSRSAASTSISIAGELVVLLGASGSGKSTLLNILGGLDVPTIGRRATTRDHDLARGDDALLTSYRREHVGFVFQFYNLIPSLTARENVALVTDIAEDPIEPADALALVGLGDRLDHFPSQLSGGEQQRVAIARAVAKRPDLLLCDEPTGALDFQTGRLVLEVIERVNRELGTTTAIITHNAPIATMADRVVRDVGRAASSKTEPQRPRAFLVGAHAGESARPQAPARLSRMRGQAITIALVVACGIASYVAMRGATPRSCARATRYYDAASASPTCSRTSSARRSTMARAASRRSPASRVVHTRIVEDVLLPIPGSTEPAIGPDRELPGRGAAAAERAASARRAHRRAGPRRRGGRARGVRRRARDCEPGDDARRRHQRARAASSASSGIALSPEYVFALGPGSVHAGRPGTVRRALDGPRAPSRRRSAWRASFDDVVVALQPGASRGRTSIADLQRAARSRTACVSAHGRERQISNHVLEGELAQLASVRRSSRRRSSSRSLRSSSTSSSRARCRCSAGRSRRSRRSGIATARSRSTTSSFVGIILARRLRCSGVGLGDLFGRGMIGLYRPFFRFPDLAFRFDVATRRHGARREPRRRARRRARRRCSAPCASRRPRRCSPRRPPSTGGRCSSASVSRGSSASPAAWSFASSSGDRSAPRSRASRSRSPPASSSPDASATMRWRRSSSSCSSDRSATTSRSRSRRPCRRP